MADKAGNALTLINSGVVTSDTLILNRGDDGGAPDTSGNPRRITLATLFAVAGLSIAAASLTLSSKSLILSGNISAPAWTTNGIRYANVAGTLTDTSSSGTVATAYTSVFAGNTIAASSSTTFTNYYGAYFKDPVAGTNVTLTNKYALGADSFKVGNSTFNSVTSTVTNTTLSGATSIRGAAYVGSDTVMGFSSVLQVGWTSGAASATQDTILARDAANTLALRNSTNAQAMLFSAGYTDASNYSYLRIDAGKTTSAVHRLMSVAAGSGTLRPIAIDGYTKSGAPTSTELPAGTWGVFKDSGGGVVVAYNDGGTIKSAALT